MINLDITIDLENNMIKYGIDEHKFSFIFGRHLIEDSSDFGYILEDVASITKDLTYNTISITVSPQNPSLFSQLKEVYPTI